MSDVIAIYFIVLQMIGAWLLVADGLSTIVLLISTVANFLRG
mgnify:CR=1 FL=1